MAIQGPPWMRATRPKAAISPEKVQTRGSGRSVTNIKIITSGREDLYNGVGGEWGNKMRKN